MNAKLKDLIERVDNWPEAAQDELANIALEIEAEFKRNYKRVREKNRDKALPANAAQNRLDAYHGAIPDWEIVGQQAQLPNVPIGADAKDRHVVAAALQLHKYAEPGDVVYLVSHNLKDMAATA